MARLKAQEASSDGTVSSMRRLSSFASIHSLLSFSKSRRTTAGTEDSITSDTDTIPAPPNRVLQETSHNIRPRPAAFGGFARKSQSKTNTALPRSKTFSSLPLPVKSKKRTQAAGSSAAIIARAATPTGPGRRYLQFSGNKPLPRSDTEPLLLASADKENITPQTKDRDSFVTDDAPRGGLPRYPSFSGLLPRSSPRLKSKPYRRLPEPSHQNKPQPDPSGLTTRVPTPPPTTLPVFAFETPSRLESLTEVVQKVSDIKAITEAQPTSYWTARLSAMLDRAKTRDLTTHLEEKRTTLRSDTDALTNKMFQLAYTRQAMVELYGHCTTVAARNSFITFQMQYAALTNQPRLTIPIGSDMDATIGAPAVGQRLERGRSSSGRKVSFVDKLLGRVKRQSNA